MNIFRSIIVSILTALFVGTALGASVAYGVERTLTVDSVEHVLKQAKVAERLTPALYEPAADLFKIDNVKMLSGEQVQMIVDRALPPEEIGKILQSVIGTVIPYVRGESAAVSSIDLTPVFERAKKAARELVPGARGDLFAQHIDQVKREGHLQAIAIPREQLDPARQSFQQIQKAETGAFLAVFLLFALIFAIAPHGIRGRLRFAGIASVMAVIPIALVAAFGFFAPAAFAGAASGQLPATIQPIANDAGAALGAALGLHVAVGALICGLIAIVCFVLNAILARGKKA